MRTNRAFVINCWLEQVYMTWIVHCRKLSGDVIESGRSGDQTWGSPVKFDNKTVEKRCLELVWNRFVLKCHKIIFQKLSFQLDIISGVTSSKTGSGAIHANLHWQAWIGQQAHFSLFLSLSALNGTRPRGYKTFHAQLNWAWNFSCS